MLSVAKHELNLTFVSKLVENLFFRVFFRDLGDYSFRIFLGDYIGCKIGLSSYLMYFIHTDQLVKWRNDQLSIKYK